MTDYPYHVAVHRTSDNGLGHGLQQEASRRGGWPRNSRRCRLKGQRGEKVATGGGQGGVGEHKKPLKHPRVWPRSDARALWRAGCRHVILERSFRLQQYAGIKINPSGPPCFPPPGLNHKQNSPLLPSLSRRQENNGDQKRAGHLSQVLPTNFRSSSYQIRSNQCFAKFGWSRVDGEDGKKKEANSLSCVFWRSVNCWTML